MTWPTTRGSFGWGGRLGLAAAGLLLLAFSLWMPAQNAPKAAPGRGAQPSTHAMSYIEGSVREHVH